MALRADDVDLGRDWGLVERFQAGDDAAFDDLYRRYFDRLRRYCERRVGDRHEAEELAQEAFVRALRALPAFGGDRKFYPWMTVIASRLCVDYHRRNARSTPHAEIDLGVQEADHGDVFADVDRRLIVAALERLAPRHREVLELREGRAWSYQRIAEHYGVTLGTVEALLHRARKALRREFRAVADDTAWAGVPVVGWLIRRAAGLRVRAAELRSVATPLGAAVASVVVAAGVTVGGGAPPPRPAPPSSFAAAPVTAISPAAVPVPTATGASKAAASGPAAQHAARRAKQQAASPYRRAKDFNQQAPVAAHLATTSIGADPGTILTDTNNYVASLIRRIP